MSGTHVVPGADRVRVEAEVGGSAPEGGGAKDAAHGEQEAKHERGEERERMQPGPGREEGRRRDAVAEWAAPARAVVVEQGHVLVARARGVFLVRRVEQLRRSRRRAAALDHVVRSGPRRPERRRAGQRGRARREGHSSRRTRNLSDGSKSLVRSCSARNGACMSTPYASSKEGFGRALDLARSGQATPSTPSGGGSPAPQVSSRGRLIRPVKRVEPATLPSRAAPPAAFTPRMASSSLNPHRAPPPPAAKTPLSPFPDPMPPLSAIADPRYQALYTTFPSRMRLGTSSLMQPNYNALVGGASGSTTPAGQPYRRPRAVVNYAEIEGLEDSEDESNDVDPNGKSGRRGTPGMGTPKPSASGAPLSAREQWGEVKSYLGTLPPGNLVMVQRANRTKHGHLYVVHSA